MTDDERNRKLAALGMECSELGRVHTWLARSLAVFGQRLWDTRPDAVEAFWTGWRKQRYRAHLVASEIELGIRRALEGVPSDGPDKWSVDIDALASKKNGNGVK